MRGGLTILPDVKSDVDPEMVADELLKCDIIGITAYNEPSNALTLLKKCRRNLINVMKDDRGEGVFQQLVEI